MTDKQPHDEANKAAVMSLNGDTLSINADAAKNIFGSSNEVFSDGLAGQLINLVTKGAEPKDKDLSFAGSMLAGIKPRDETEAMLGLQMIAIHNATLTFARRLAHVENMRQQDSAERALNKLARTYALQLQALQKYRSGGKQKVVVKHVHINEGGQAIVGNVERGVADEKK